MTVRNPAPYILILLIVFLQACSSFSSLQSPHRETVEMVTAWIENNAPDSTSVMIPGLETPLVASHPAVIVPGGSQTFDALSIINQRRPDYVVTFNDLVWNGVTQQSWFQQRYEYVETFTTSRDPSTPAQLYVYQPSPFDVGKQVSITERFNGDGPNAIAYKVNSLRIYPGSNVFLTIYWEVDSIHTRDDIILTLQLVSSANQFPVFTIDENFDPDYVSFYDQTMAVTYYQFSLPVDVKAGNYEFQLRLMQPNGATSPVILANGEQRHYLHLADLENPVSVTTSRILPQIPYTADFLEAERTVVILTGYDLVTPTITGSHIRLGLVWHVMEPLQGDYTVFVHLRDQQNNIIAQDDHKPLQWSFPTNLWEPGEFIYDVYMLELHQEFKRGHYTLFTGMYDAETEQRVEILDNSGERLADRELLLTSIEIR